MNVLTKCAPVIENNLTLPSKKNLDYECHLTLFKEAISQDDEQEKRAALVAKSYHNP